MKKILELAKTFEEKSNQEIKNTELMSSIEIRELRKNLQSLLNFGQLDIDRSITAVTEKTTAKLEENQALFLEQVKQSQRQARKTI